MIKSHDGILYKNIAYFDAKQLYNTIEGDVILETDLFPGKVPFFPKLNNYLGAVSSARALYISSRTQFDDRNELHASLLHALHFSITRITDVPPRISPQWEVIGFQGNDPTSDLRSTGLLGLLFPFMLFSKYPKIAADILSAAHAPGKEFPMMIVLIACTDASINVGLKTDLLQRAHNAQEGFEVLGLFFAGIVAKIAKQWINKKLNFVNHYSVFDEIVQKCSLDPVGTMAYAAENNI